MYPPDMNFTKLYKPPPQEMDFEQIRRGESSVEYFLRKRRERRRLQILVGVLVTAALTFGFSYHPDATLMTLAVALLAVLSGLHAVWVWGFSRRCQEEKQIDSEEWGLGFFLGAVVPLMYFALSTLLVSSFLGRSGQSAKVATIMTVKSVVSLGGVVAILILFAVPDCDEPIELWFPVLWSLEVLVLEIDMHIACRLTR